MDNGMTAFSRRRGSSGPAENRQVHLHHGSAIAMIEESLASWGRPLLADLDLPDPGATTSPA